ncbi:MAG: GntR family transcriptional regulator, partial [Pseudoflavonifractor sp.]
LQPGGQLPTEPELCKQYGAGRNSVREAIKQLQAYGVVYIRRADGTYVCDSYRQKMLDPMLYNIILHKNDWKDFVTLRAAIDIGTLHMAMALPGLEDCLPELERLVNAIDGEMHSACPSTAKVMELDTRFHSIIAQTTHNPQLVTVTEYITRLSIPSRLETVERVLKDGEIDNFVSLHRQIVTLIANRDVSQIERVVLDHYVYWDIDTQPGKPSASEEAQK